MIEGGCCEPLVLPAAVHREIVLHAQESAPQEAVGLLGGTRRDVQIALRLRNVAPGTRSFVADPYDQFRALRVLASRGLELCAIYHSHPGGGTGPSQLDLDFAQRWSCVHLIAALGRPGRPDGECRGFVVGEDGFVVPVPVVIAGLA